MAPLDLHNHRDHHDHHNDHFAYVEEIRVETPPEIRMSMTSRGKASIRDAPQVYTDASGINRVSFLTDFYGNNKNPTFIDPDDHSSTRRQM